MLKGGLLFFWDTMYMKTIVMYTCVLLYNSKHVFEQSRTTTDKK